MVPEVGLHAPAGAILQQLIDQTPWRAEQIVLWGKRYLQPRLIAWYGDSGQRYAYSGIRLEPLPWTETLAHLKYVVEEAAGASFNSVLLNYYRNERDSMGFHSDDEPELGPRPVIASLSLGEQRTFIMQHRSRKDVPKLRIALRSGSLLVMQGETQKDWKHGIQKESARRGPRINLTFRKILPDKGVQGR